MILILSTDLHLAATSPATLFIFTVYTVDRFIFHFHWSSIYIRFPGKRVVLHTTLSARMYYL
jgi:hypothetical protein